MLDENGGKLKTIAWSEICPWLAIFRTFRLAICFRILLLAAVAVLLTVLVWGVLNKVFAPDPDQTELAGPCAGFSWNAVTGAVPDEPGLPGTGRCPVISRQFGEPGVVRQYTNPLFGTWIQLSQPLLRCFHPNATGWDIFCLLIGGLASLAVWAYFGGAITRIAAVQIACGERVSLGDAMRYAFRKWPAYFVAPLVPLLGVVLSAVPVWLVGLLLNANVGVLPAALIWPLMLVAGMVMALLLLGLIFGWPLMWATISTEGTDSFDALSRSYAYVFQRPLQYLFYAIVAAAFGTISWILVSNFAAAVVALTNWAASWGCGTERIDAIAAGGETLGRIGYAGSMLILFWIGCVKLLAVGFLYGYFWTAVTVIYLLLRRDVDATEMDEVYLDADADEQTYGLPPMTTDDAGAPVIDDNK